MVVHGPSAWSGVDEDEEFIFPEINKLFGMRKDYMDVFWFELGCLRKYGHCHNTRRIGYEQESDMTSDRRKF